MTVAHTLGPWEVDDGFVASVNGWIICDPHCKRGPEDRAERDANAALIAAAPELLAALEAVVAAFAPRGDKRHMLEDMPCLIDARAAIAKARGGKS